MVNSHIIPKHYLKGFANDAECIFTYPNPEQNTDKQCLSRGGGAVVKNTAVKRGFYTEPTEKSLSDNFERIGSQILRKILQKLSITEDEKLFFAEYVLSFMYRGHGAKLKMEKLYPNIVKNWNSIEAFFNFRIERNSSANELDYFNILKSFENSSEHPIKAWENSIISKKHQEVYEILLSRRWWVLETIGIAYFITSDNPLFYSTSSGMVGTVQITFPLSQHMAIIFDETGNPSNSIRYCTIGTMQYTLVDEINRRTADSCEQIYSPKRDLLLPELVGYKLSNPEYIRCPI